MQRGIVPSLASIGLAAFALHCGDGGGSGASDAEGGSGPGGSSTGGAGGTGGGGAGGMATTSTGGAGGAEAVVVLLAQGHVGRTMLSCDDGASWVQDRSDDDAVRCENGFDCDHHVGSATGMVASHGFAVMSSGWGTPGTVRRSHDGATWELVHELDFPFASIAAAPEGLMGATPRPWLSTNDGATWGEVPMVYLAPPLRQSIHIPFGSGRFLLTSEGNGLRVFLSDDQGDTFQESSALPSGCLAISLVHGNGTVAMQHASGVCRSNDGGQTWSVAPVGAGLGLRTLDFVAGRFVMLGESQNQCILHESPDAETWTATPTNLAVPLWNVGTGHNDQTGTLVAASGAYEAQRFFRSTDGVSWSEAAGPGGHPLRRFVSVALEAPACR